MTPEEAPLISMTVEDRPPNPLVRVIVRGLMSDEAGAKALLKLYTEHPRAPYYDRLFDLTAYKTGLDAQNLARVASAYRELNTDPSFPCRTAIVTRDPHFQLWARSMDFQFQGRQHRAFATVEEAEAWLATPLETRKAEMSQVKDA
jgi:hypothetical protein